MEKLIDLHVHSTISDGTDAPQEIMRLAAERGLAAVALTDHDTVMGGAAAQAAAARYGVETITGIELTLRFRRRQIHVLAYGFEPSAPAFRAFYDAARRERERGMAALVENIRRRGIAITVAEVNENAVAAFDVYAVMRTIKRRPEFRGAAVWNKYIFPAMEELHLDMHPSPHEAFAAVRASGGVLSLAHFPKQIGLYGLDRDEQEAAIAELVDCGLDGMERFYPTFCAEDKAFAAAMIKKYRLLATGGSDYHGANRRGTELGTGIENNLAVPYEIFLALQERANERRRAAGLSPL